MELNDEEKRDFSIFFWREALNYNIDFGYRLDFDTFVPTKPGTGYGKTEKNFLTREAKIYLNLKSHDSLPELEETAFHEMRHLMQHMFLPNRTYFVYHGLLQASPEEKNLQLEIAQVLDAVFYFYNPLEIDARIFAKTRGDMPSGIVFDQLSLDDLIHDRESFLRKCREIACFLDVDDPDIASIRV